MSLIKEQINFFQVEVKSMFIDLSCVAVWVQDYISSNNGINTVTFWGPLHAQYDLSSFRFHISTTYLGNSCLVWLQAQFATKVLFGCCPWCWTGYRQIVWWWILCKPSWQLFYNYLLDVCHKNITSPLNSCLVAWTCFIKIKKECSSLPPEGEEFYFVLKCELTSCWPSHMYHIPLEMFQQDFSSRWSNLLNNVQFLNRDEERKPCGRDADA